jgi:phosphopantothenoylcysteine decarboxylase/phosphopantothenate--cysteine ligase
MDHIALARWADLILIAPATANTLAKLRAGLADDLLSTLCLATDRPIVVAPAMNRLMWQHSATQENLDVLKSRGVKVIAPESGEQACGEVGEGRMAEPESIVQQLTTLMNNDETSAQPESSNRFWRYRPVLITAGPTQEPIDPVRFIGNRSSGKMGFALAQAAAEKGADVILIAGPVNLPTPNGVKRIDVKTADEMFKVVQDYYADAEVFISAAAVADYRIAQPSEQKLKKRDDKETLSLELVKNPDIVAWVAQQPDKPYVVGFAAETENVIEYAKQKLAKKGLDMICANEVGEGKAFERDDNTLSLIANAENGVEVETLPTADKLTLAHQILERIEKTNS